MIESERSATGLLDTSVVIDLHEIDPEKLPLRVAISAITLAELSGGPVVARDPAERARRQDRLQRTEAAFDPIPFDAEAARAFGRIYAAVVDAGRQPRRRVADLQIAAIALAGTMSLVTRNPTDFRGLEGLVDVVSV